MSAEAGNIAEVAVLPDNTIWVIMGQKGSGKTQFVIRHIIPRYKRVVILDSLGEYRNFVTQDIKSFYQALEANLDREVFTICYRPLDKQPEAFFEIVESLTDILIVVEEADFYCSPHYINEHLMYLIKYGRHFTQNLVLVSRRPAEVSRQVTAQSDVVISFRQTEPNDIDYFKKVSATAINLPQLHEFKYPERMVEGKHYLILKGRDHVKKIT